MSEELLVSPEEETSAPNFLVHLPKILWQRRWLVIVPAVVCSLAGLATAFLLPPSYRASATLLVESQQLPSAIAGSPVTNLIDRRIAKIRQQVLSRPNLVQLIQTNNLYPNERGSQPLSKLIEKMREATAINPVNADIQQGGQGSNTIAFALSFDYDDAAKAQLIAQAFVDRLLDLDSTTTTADAQNTVDFLQDQATTLSKQINEIETKIQGIKGSNGAALANGGMMMMPGGGGGYEGQIAALQRENSQLESQITVLNSADKRDPIITQAEAQLASAKAVYSDNHPDVKIAEQRLAEARRFAASNSVTATNIGTIRSQIASNNTMIARLNSAQAQESARTSASYAAQSRAPLVAEQVAQLQSQAEGLRANYQTVATNLMNAKTSAKMSTEQKGERLSIIDPPVVPDEPNWPRRPLVILGGILLGLGLGVALALMFELFRHPIRGVAAIKHLTGAQPLVVVPTIRARDAFGPNRRSWWPFGGKRRPARVADIDIEMSSVA